MRDIWAQMARYRKVKTLADGSRVLLRPLTKNDGKALLDLFSRASQDDLEYFRDDASDPAVIENWIDHLDLRRVYPLVATVDDKIVGDATLHFGKRYHRHLAWVRIFLDRSYRRRGIGTLLLSSLIEIARHVGLQQLTTEVVNTQHNLIKALQDLGFQHEVTLRDYFIASSSEDTMDMSMMVLRLVERSGEF